MENGPTKASPRETKGRNNTTTNEGVIAQVLMIKAPEMLSDSPKVTQH